MSHVIDHVPGLRCEIVKDARGANTDAHSARHFDFTFPGGTLGRGEDNDLVLPDERQQIANLQAIILITGSGQCQISNRGGMPIRLNGVPIERGQQRPIGRGDQLEIAAYVLHFDELATADAEHVDTGATIESSREIEHNEVPGEIWTALDAEFPTIDAQPPAQPTPEPPHPLLQVNATGNRPDNPLILDGGETPLLQEDDDLSLSWLFADDDPFMQMPLTADMTPTVLADVPHRASVPATSDLASLVPDWTGWTGHRDALAPFEEAVPPKPDFHHAADAALHMPPDASAPLASAVDDLLTPTGKAISTPPVGAYPESERPLATLLEPGRNEHGIADISAPGPSMSADSPARQPAHRVPPPQPAAGAQTPIRAATPDSGIDNARVIECPPLPALVDTPSPWHTDTATLTFRDPPERREPTIGGSLRPEPQMFSCAHDAPDGRPSPGASATLQTNGQESDTSLPPVLARVLLDGMGLNHVPTASVGRDELKQIGHLLRLFADHTVRLSATAAMDSGSTPLQNDEPDHSREHNPFYTLPSGEHVLRALFMPPLADLMCIETAAAQALADVESRRKAGENRSRPDDHAKLGTVLSQLAPEQMELNLAKSGMRFLSHRTGKAALWDHFVCQYQRVATWAGLAISHERAPVPGFADDNALARSAPAAPQAAVHTGKSADAGDRGLDVGAAVCTITHGSTSADPIPAYGQQWGYW